MKIFRFLFAILIFHSVQSKAQSILFYRDTNFQVINNGVQIANAFAAGFNSPIPASIDLNGDGILDLIVFDGTSYRLSPFINKGTPNKTDFVYAPEYRNRFPYDLEGWVRTYDFDCDGDLDLFTYSNAAIKVYRNNYSSQNGISFSLVTPQIDTHYGNFLTNLYVSRVNMPALTDVDNDGDMDILAFSIAGSWVEYNRNFSMDSTGSCNNFMFYNVPQCWGYFALGNLSNVGLLPPIPSCPLLPADPFRLNPSAQHSGSALLALDMDGDGDKDLLNGDILSPNVLYLQNCGNPDSAWMCAQDSAFPSYDIPAEMKDVAGPYYFDIDNDGNNDLVVANFYTGEDYYNMLSYKNTTNNSTNVFAKTGSRFLVDNMIETGTGAHPTFVDVDGDGLKDLIIGNDYYFNNAANTGKLEYYRNTGTASHAAFTLITDDFAGISAYGVLGLYPAFGDLDADGDMDLLLGESSGNILYFKNNAGAGNPMILTLVSANYQSINVGNTAIPQIVDIDKDGKLDLLIGERNGNLNYYRNTSTSAVPVFSLINDSLGGVDVRKSNGYAGFSAPLLFDNGSGYELLVGSESGYLYHYNNIDGNLSGTFNLLDSMFQGIYEPIRCAPAKADLDNDGRYDLMIGNIAGGLVLYTQNSLLSSLSPEVNSAFFNLYPNPVKNILNIQVDQLNNNSKVKIQIFDIIGQRVYISENLNLLIAADVSALNSGTYLCKITAGSQSFCKRFVKE